VGRWIQIVVAQKKARNLQSIKNRAVTKNIDCGCITSCAHKTLDIFDSAGTSNIL
jgi:hypothetical protein